MSNFFEDLALWDVSRPEAERLPEAPKREAFTDADAFKAAIAKWAAEFENVYSAAFPASNAEVKPLDPGPEPTMPSGPEEPRIREGETRQELGVRLAAWLPKQEQWFFDEYLTWEIKRTQWYVAKMTLRDWEALRRLEERQKADRKHRIAAAILRFVITGLVAGATVLIGFKLFG